MFNHKFQGKCFTKQPETGEGGGILQNRFLGNQCCDWGELGSGQSHKLWPEISAWYPRHTRHGNLFVWTCHHVSELLSTSCISWCMERSIGSSALQRRARLAQLTLKTKQLQHRKTQTGRAKLPVKKRFESQPSTTYCANQPFAKFMKHMCFVTGWWPTHTYGHLQ